MAKKRSRDMSMPTGPTAEERLRWDAERIAENGIKGSPAFKKATKIAKKHLKEANREVKKALKPKARTP